MNLFDMIRQAGGGDPYSALASQFGLSEAEVAKAVQAFMPAFSAGLKRSTSDPQGMMELMQRLASGEYLRAFLHPDWASGAGQRSGDDALRFLFGSPEAAQALARQAASFTGLAPEKLRELMPAVAAMIFGGLAKQAGAANPVLEVMLKQFKTGASAGPDAPKGPLDRYEEEQAKRESPADDLAGVQAEMMRAGLAAFQSGTAAWQKAVGEALRSSGSEPAQTEAPSGNLFGDLFEPGLRLSQAYQREVEATLDRLRPDAKRP